ncbi:Lsr2 family protein [Actinosynnema sp. NPDC020468]|uniref:histone-like nucleoid-structuring protein Lsr2 n=1 Tax=Actinosynnema sp. NPDC020468 TaxID=3154488 RepID=UPI0033F6D66A
MVQKITTRLVDDVDGSDAAETLTFELDGAHYEIDLSEANAAVLRKTLDPFVLAARPTSKRNGRADTKKRRVRPVTLAGAVPTKVDREQSNAIREWANRNGFTVSTYGRIPAKVVSAYEQAH